MKSEIINSLGVIGTSQNPLAEFVNLKNLISTYLNDLAKDYPKVKTIEDYVDPVLLFVKEWMDDNMRPVIYGNGSTYIDLSFQQWFCDVEQKAKFLNTLKDKIEKKEKLNLLELRKACINGEPYAFREKYVAMTNIEIREEARRTALKYLPTESRINDSIIRNVVDGRVGICSAFIIYDEVGNSHYECGCCLGDLRRAPVTSLSSVYKDENDVKRLLFYCKRVYPNIYLEIIK